MLLLTGYYSLDNLHCRLQLLHVNYSQCTCVDVSDVSDVCEVICAVYIESYLN